MPVLPHHVLCPGPGTCGKKTEVELENGLNHTWPSASCVTQTSLKVALPFYVSPLYPQDLARGL